MNSRLVPGTGEGCIASLDDPASGFYHLAIMENIFSVNYWFDLTPIRMSSGFEIGFFVGFAILLILGLVLRIVKKQRQDKFERMTLERLANTALTVSVLGLLWLFMAFEEIQIFGARFWAALLMIGGLMSLVRIALYTRKEVPALRAAEQSKAEANKYLPRRR